MEGRAPGALSGEAGIFSDLTQARAEMEVHLGAARAENLPVGRTGRPIAAMVEPGQR